MLLHYQPVSRAVSVGLFGMLVATTGTSWAQTVVTPEGTRDIERGDRTVVQERVGPGDRVVEERVVERRPRGEVYVSGFGGFTWGHSFTGTEGTGTLKGQDFGGRDLANSVVYGAKLGYFHPGRLNWLGLEVEGFSTTPHIEQGAGFQGSHLRVTTLAFNVIARTKLGCRNRDVDDRTVRRDRDDVHGYWDPLAENARCPLQLYAGAGPGIFWADASNQFGHSTDSGRVGLNALAGAKYFMTRNVAIFGEYKYNYAHFNFSEIQGSTAGLSGNYHASHVVGGLAFHF
jgi:opacity protein-like surface antigen